jgi:hypothetical protein
MSDYTMLIYQEPLTDFECEQIIGLCYDAKLEKIDDQKSRPIRNSHSRIFDDFETHSCYRLHSQRGLESIQLIGKEPLYVGLFNNDIEARLIEIANLWMEILISVIISRLSS